VRSGFSAEGGRQFHAGSLLHAQIYAGSRVPFLERKVALRGEKLSRFGTLTTVAARGCDPD